MTRDQALSKIRKCLALGKSTNPHEAANAMRQAQKLMAEYKVSDHDMSMADVNEARVRARSPALNVWEVRLANLIADAFGCEQFSARGEYLTHAGSWAHKREYVFVGLDAAPTVAAYVYDVLARQCAAARLAHIRKQPKACKPLTKTSRGDEFARGWVSGVRQLVERFATGERDAPLLLAYMQAKHPDLTTTPPRDSTALRKVAFGHAMAGMDAAQSAQLNRGVGGMPEQALLTSKGGRA
nr:DUF2786 domain-containing protein [Rhodoferax sp.]